MKKEIVAIALKGKFLGMLCILIKLDSNITSIFHISVSHFGNS